MAANFNLHVKISGSDVAGSPAPGVESPGTTYTLATGTYVVSEDAAAGYTESYSGDSDAKGNITLAFGDIKTVTITNNDIAVPQNHSGGGNSSRIYPSSINIVKTAVPLALTTGPGSVTYTYKVTNPGTVALSNVSVTDDKVSLVNYVSGDVNADNLLQPNETWIYTSKMNLNATTMNTATAKGSANGMIVTDIAFDTVVVTPLVVATPTVTGGAAVTPTVTGGAVVTPTVTGGAVVTPTVTGGAVVTPTVTDGAAVTPTVTGGAVVTPTVTGGAVVTSTVTGGQLPETSTPLYELLLIGVALTLVGAVGWRRRKRYA